MSLNTKLQNNTKIHHFHQQTNHSRNQPTSLTITIQTNYTISDLPINLLSILTTSTSLTSNVRLIRLFDETHYLQAKVRSYNHYYTLHVIQVQVQVQVQL